MSDTPCPCSGGAFPAVVFNPPAQPAIAYRWGDYDGFRAALLQRLEGETELSRPDGAPAWRPTPDSGDLALQIAEWWAYLADILTLYAERAANQAYIRTADLPESLPRLVPLLGYRPRPAIGAQVTLAGLVRGPRPVTLPQGLQVQSKPGPGQQPQVFELDAATVMQPGVPVAALPQTAPLAPFPAGLAAGQSGQVLLAARPSNLKVGDEVLLLGTGWAGQSGNFALGTVGAITPAPGGTSVAFAIGATGGSGGDVTGAANWRLLKSASSALLYPYLQGIQPFGFGGILNNIGETYVELASVVRSIAPGDVILVENPTPGTATAPTLGSVTGVREIISYANNPTNPSVWPPAGSPPNTTEPAVPIPHSLVLFYTQGAIQADPSTLVVRYGFADVGTLVDPPVAGDAQTGAVQTGSVTLDPGALAAAAVAPGSPLLVADANGDGAAATLGDGGAVSIDPAAPPLVPPLQTFANLLAFSRGKTVADEVLGDGNPGIAGQDFQLRNAPVTYLADAPGRSGQGYSSTITLQVDGVAWTETPSFFGQAANAQVFVTREDTQGNTHVLGGDGVNGARFPSGAGNVVASYRTGAGAAAPPPTSISVLLQPQPGLRALVNPVPPFGGSDADAPADLRRLAPLSVLTFGRAVSVDDYAAVAAAAPGVARVGAAYAFDSVQQRPVVSLWVGDDAGAVAAAQKAIGPISDPNRPISISAANPVQLTISLTYVRDPRTLDATVQAAVRAALADPASGLFGTGVVQIGQAFYDSQIFAACLAVPGVQAVHGLAVRIGPPRFVRYVWQLSSVWLRGIRAPVAAAGGCTGHRYTPGADGFFMLANTPQALQLNGMPGT